MRKGTWKRFTAMAMSLLTVLGTGLSGGVNIVYAANSESLHKNTAARKFLRLRYVSICTLYVPAIFYFIVLYQYTSEPAASGY